MLYVEEVLISPIPEQQVYLFESDKILTIFTRSGSPILAVSRESKGQPTNEAVPRKILQRVTRQELPETARYIGSFQQDWSPGLTFYCFERL